MNAHCCIIFNLPVLVLSSWCCHLFTTDWCCGVNCGCAQNHRHVDEDIATDIDGMVRNNTAGIDDLREARRSDKPCREKRKHAKRAFESFQKAVESGKAAQRVIQSLGQARSSKASRFLDEQLTKILNHERTLEKVMTTCNSTAMPSAPPLNPETQPPSPPLRGLPKAQAQVPDAPAGASEAQEAQRAPSRVVPSTFAAPQAQETQRAPGKGGPTNPAAVQNKPKRMFPQAQEAQRAPVPVTPAGVFPQAGEAQRIPGTGVPIIHPAAAQDTPAQGFPQAQKTGGDSLRLQAISVKHQMPVLSTSVLPAKQLSDVRITVMLGLVGLTVAGLVGVLQRVRFGNLVSGRCSMNNAAILADAEPTSTVEAAE